VLFIINNTVDIALAVGAHGVHLGLEDLPPQAVRHSFPTLITGYSCNNMDDCATATAAGVGYAGVGPAFFTNTKTNLRPTLGVSGVSNIVNKLAVPTVAIGGIDLTNADQFASAPNTGIAVSSVLCTSDTPYETAKKLREMAGK
jgi:thiamine-phosphate diphosphorylase